MNKFTLGAITGISSLALAVPLLASVSSAESDDAIATVPARSVPTQACLTAKADFVEVQLSHIDEDQEERQTLMQEHAQQLRSIAAIGDEAARQAAFLEMHEAMRGQRLSLREDLPADVQAAKDAVQDACGNEGFGMGMGGGMGMGRGMHKGMGMGAKGEGPMHTDMLEQLGMTEEEFEAALDSGKTPRELADEKGIELPQRSMGGRRWGN